MSNSSSSSDNPLREYVRKTEGIIRSLKGDLAFYRAQNEALSNERSEQLRTLAEGDFRPQDPKRLEGELRFLSSERDRLARQVQPLERENRQLKERCAELEAALAEARRKHDEAQEVVTYLEAQIEQIESVVQLLSEHKRFMKNSDD
jgi:chromosome segregation ATPase